MYRLKKISIKKISNGLINITIFFLLLGYPLQILTNQKIHYYFFIASSFILLFINIKSIVNVKKVIYFSLISLPLLHFLAFKAPDNAFWFSLIPYLLTPLVFWNNCFSDYDFEDMMKIFNGFTYFYFLGIIMQIAGIESPYLNIDITYTNGVLHDRYGSFAGGTLALGLTGSISLMYSLMQFLYNKDRGAYLIFTILVSFLTLLFAQSRRFYLLVFFVGLLLFWYNPNVKRKKRNINFKTIFLTISIIFLVFVGLYSIKDTNYYLERIFSVFDFTGDASNLMRVTKWVEAINYFLNNIWFGMGLGTTGTIGKNFDPAVDSLSDIIVAESYYLKILVECGLIFGSVYFFGQFYFLKTAFKRLSKKQYAFPSICVIFYFLESFTSTSLESILSNILFWISISVLSRKEAIDEVDNVQVCHTG